MAACAFANLKRLIASRALEPFHYKDHGSLVSLSRFSTVGSLMGNLVGGRMAIEGRLARFVYVSLYRLHLIGHSWLAEGRGADPGRPCQPHHQAPPEAALIRRRGSISAASGCGGRRAHLHPAFDGRLHQIALEGKADRHPGIIAERGLSPRRPAGRRVWRRPARPGRHSSPHRILNSYSPHSCWRCPIAAGPGSSRHR